MSDYRVGVVVGSLRRDSFNRRLADALVKLAPSEFLFKQLQIGDLPLYNQDDGASPAEPVRRLKAGITESYGILGGILLVTPEYKPLPAGHPQECPRSCIASLRPEGLGGQTGGSDRVLPRVPLGRLLRNRIYATRSHTSTCPRWGSRKPSFR